MAHPCPQCDKTFSRASFVTRHIQSAHEAVKRHLCSTCDASFARSDVCKRHQKLCGEGKLAYRGKKRRKTTGDSEETQAIPALTDSPSGSTSSGAINEGHEALLHFAQTPVDDSIIYLESPGIIADNGPQSPFFQHQYFNDDDYFNEQPLFSALNALEDQQVAKCNPTYGLTPGDSEIPAVDLSTYDGNFFAGPMRIIEGFRSAAKEISFIPSPRMLAMLASRTAATGTNTCFAIHLPTFVWRSDVLFLGFALGLLPAVASKEPEMQAFSTGALAIKRLRYYENFSNVIGENAQDRLEAGLKCVNRRNQALDDPTTLRKVDIMLKAFSVYHLVGLAHSNPVQRELAHVWQERFVRFARCTDIFTRAQSTIQLPMDDLSLAWTLWIDDETLRRTAFSIFLSDLTACARQQTFYTNVDLAQEILPIPLPSTNATWTARYSQEWALCYTAYGQSPTLRQVLAHLFGKQDPVVANSVIGIFGAQIVSSLLAFTLEMLESRDKVSAWPDMIETPKKVYLGMTLQQQQFVTTLGVVLPEDPSSQEAQRCALQQIKLAQLKFGGLRFEDAQAVLSSDCSMANGRESWLSDLAALTL